MNGLEAALLRITDFLHSRKIPYMVIGGFANLRWGRSRLTEDVDISIDLPEPRWPDFIAALRAGFSLRAEDPVQFASESRVIPIVEPGGVRIDLILAGLPYETAAIRRAVAVPVGSGMVRICTAEDLILHKIVSDRPRDREDVEGIVLRQQDRLDREYLDPKVHELAVGLDRPDLEAFYRECLARTGETKDESRPRGSRPP